ncbi:MAG TPA: YkgJ family cysteine cluster protein [Desulfobacterales bacterium]|nr:YkgJ family cysteine cluster protein [Desulfobacterales bacterium]
MTLKEKKGRLQEIYERFEGDAYEFKKDAICKIGCTFCCTDVGNVDITTLEGVVIRERVNRLPQPLRGQVKQKIAQNRLEKERETIAQCPFLKEDKTCLIYDIRPFSCRQLYSIRECRGRGPTVHRQATELAKKAVKEMQRLDDTGYSGHISFILYLLDRPAFRKPYLSGAFDPGKIANFGKTHRLVINRFAK